MRSLDSKPPRGALGAFVLLHLPPPGQPGSDPTPQTQRLAPLPQYPVAGTPTSLHPGCQGDGLDCLFWVGALRLPRPPPGVLPLRLTGVPPASNPHGRMCFPARHP